MCVCVLDVVETDPACFTCWRLIHTADGLLHAATHRLTADTRRGAGYGRWSTEWNTQTAHLSIQVIWQLSPLTQVTFHLSCRWL